MSERWRELKPASFPYLITDIRANREVVIAQFRYRADALRCARNTGIMDRAGGRPTYRVIHRGRVIYDGHAAVPPLTIDA